MRDDEVGTEPGVCNVSRLLSKRPSFVPSLCSTNPLLATHVVFPSLATAIGGAEQPEKRIFLSILSARKKNVTSDLEMRFQCSHHCHLPAVHAMASCSSLAVFDTRCRRLLMLSIRLPPGEGPPWPARTASHEKDPSTAVMYRPVEPRTKGG